jgi:hypothetical protein
MYHLFKTFFGLTALAALLILSICGGCADIPDDKMPDEPVNTVVIVDSAFYGDTLVRCSTVIVGAGAASVRCDTAVYDGLSVPYTVSRVDELLNGYCLFPITFTAFPRAEDLGRIEAIYLEWGPGEGARAQLSPPDWSAEFAIADTGAHAVRMLVAMKGVDYVLTEEFEVRTAMMADVRPVNIPVGDVGVEYVLKVSGLRHGDAWWVWDLRNIGNGVVKAREDSVLIFVDGEYDTEVYLYQEDAWGVRTPAVAVGFIALYTTHSVSVSVVGGAAEILPQREFTVPHAGDASVSVSVNARNNLKIESVWVNGELRWAFHDRVVADTSIPLENVRADARVLVSVAKADTVMPQVIINWPVSGNTADTVWKVPVMCLEGAVGYKLNKKMASGYIKWTRTDTLTGLLTRDSLRTNIPGDINPASHFVATAIPGSDISYLSPKEYLNEGVQRYRQAESANADKQMDFLLRTPYRVEMQFTDSLGNKSNVAVRVITTFDASYGTKAACEAYYNGWKAVE